MKKVFLLTMVMAVASCSNDDNTQENNNDELLSGTWKLKTYQQGWSQPYDYQGNEIIWNFDAGNGTIAVTIDHQAVINSYMPFQEADNYPFFMADNGTVYISSEHHTYWLEDNQLHINNNLEADGYMFVFER